MDPAQAPQPPERPQQPLLLDLPLSPQPSKPAKPEPPAAPPKVKPVNRAQSVMRCIAVDELLPPDHKARAIWDLSGELDLSPFAAGIRSREGEKGRPATNYQLLLCVWLYAYSEGVSAARKLEALMGHEPGLMWLSALEEVNYHTLSDFRTHHQAELEQLLAELLGVLSKEGWVTLERVVHDGTKVRAQGGVDSFRRETTLEREIEKAQQVVAELSARGEQEEAAENERRQAARRRAARERLERMQLAAQELQALKAAKEEKKKGAAKVEEKQEEKQGKQQAEKQQEKPEEKPEEKVRVSLTEPEARIMKHGDGALLPSYNVQISTDAKEGIIVGVHLTQCSGDSASLAPAMEQVRETVGRYPEQAVADGGFTNQAAIQAMEGMGIDFYGSLPDPQASEAGAMKAAGIDPAFGPSHFRHEAEQKRLQCPAGKRLHYVRTNRDKEVVYFIYQAAAAECGSCEFQARCCPQRADKGRQIAMRVSESPAVMRFREKMKSEEGRAIYRVRGWRAEFPNAWIKDKLGIRKFRLRGVAKAGVEALWAVLTYDVQQWIRLSWRRRKAAERVGAERDGMRARGEFALA